MGVPDVGESSKIEGERQPVVHEEASNKVFTIPNVISFVRLCMVPVYMVLLHQGFDLAATLVFALAAATDFLDGQIARRTNSVSKLGQILDPFVDRVLMLTGVLGVFLVGRLPLWIILVVVCRDLFILCGGVYLFGRHGIRIPVVYPGKFATTFLFVGFAGLLLNWPLIDGLGVCDIAWLPGFASFSVSWGIWFIYAGLILSVGTAIYYCVAAAKELKDLQATPK